ncbi:MAG: hypothetical protein OXI74_17740 [Rhodospirillaceae bacterium]|nr:hypothetical protein [Rhodospirillaceae bacterium]
MAGGIPQFCANREEEKRENRADSDPGSSISNRPAVFLPKALQKFCGGEKTSVRKELRLP